MSTPSSSLHSRFRCEVAQFSAVSTTTHLSPFRHPGLDPGSIWPRSHAWTADQIRGDDESKMSIACEVARFSGLSS